MEFETVWAGLSLSIIAIICLGEACNEPFRPFIYLCLLQVLVCSYAAKRMNASVLWWNVFSVAVHKDVAYLFMSYIKQALGTRGLYLCAFMAIRRTLERDASAHAGNKHDLEQRDKVHQAQQVQQAGEQQQPLQHTCCSTAPQEAKAAHVDSKQELQQQEVANVASPEQPALYPCKLNVQQPSLQAGERHQQLQQCEVAKRDVNGMSRQAYSELRNSSKGRPLSTTQQTCVLYNPMVHKWVVEAARAKSKKPHQQYASCWQERTRPPATASPLTNNAAAHFIQTACRVAVKINVPNLPSDVPECSLAQLKLRLQKFQRLLPPEPAAVRAGCIVLSFCALPSGSQASGPLAQDTLNEMEAVVRELAQEHGLVGSVTVQACHQPAWGQTSKKHEPLNMALPTPLLVTSPASASSPDAQPTPAIHSQQEGALCSFQLSLTAPPQLELRGWHSEADAPEDLPDDTKSRSLCLLASLGGHFLPITIIEQQLRAEGERVVQVRVALPACILAAAGSCPRVLELELWAAGSLKSSASAVLLPACHAEAAAQLHDWISGCHAGGGAEAGGAGADQAHAAGAALGALPHAASYRLPTSSTAFIGDLVHWLRFRAAAGADFGNGTAGRQLEGQEQELLQQMTELGEGLLDYCLCCGLLDVAGLLLDGLLAPPFCWSPRALLDGRPELDSAAPAAEDQEDGGTGGQGEQAGRADAGAGSSAHHQLHSGQELDPAAEQQHNNTHQAPKAPPLWVTAACGCLHGFGKGMRGEEDASSCLTVMHLPTEEAYQEWGAAFTRSYDTHRAACLFIATLIGSAKALHSEDCFRTLLILSALVPYIYHYWEPKVALQRAKYIYLFGWTLMGCSLVSPVEENTRTLFSLRVEILVLALFSSPRRLYVIARERVLTTLVFALLLVKLEAQSAMLRSVLVNLSALAIEAGLDVYVRCLFLRHVREQQAQGKKYL